MKELRAARIRLSPETLRTLLEAPPGARLLAAGVYEDYQSLELVFEHPSLPLTPPGHLPELLAGFRIGSVGSGEPGWNWSSAAGSRGESWIVPDPDVDAGEVAYAFFCRACGLRFLAGGATDRKREPCPGCGAEGRQG